MDATLQKMVHTDGLEPPKAEAKCSTGTRNCRSATYAKETQLSKIKKSELRFRLWNPPALDSRLLVFLEIQERESAPAALGSITR
jgi:hypothetical protein